ncbi:hypothetical protein [Teichococcus aestuarii]|uniref:hypothetical protein n=1 Tax=Teichococcus aestuarii TaxID=568898 RepID=UPI0036229E15
MSGVSCLGGHTQIGRVLAHAETETAREKVAALVFVGDAVEEEADALCHAAGRLGLRGTPAFVFQEGRTRWPPECCGRWRSSRAARTGGWMAAAPPRCGTG